MDPNKYRYYFRPTL